MFMNKKHILPVIVILLLSLVTLNWFREGRLIYFWDATFPLSPDKAITQYSYIWHDTFAFGQSDILGVKMLLYFYLIKIPFDFFHSILLSQMFLYYLLFSISGLSMYFFAFNLLKEDFNYEKKSYQFIHLGSISAALFYMFNLYTILFLWRIFSTSLFLYSVLPLIFLFYIRYMKKDSSINNLIFLIFLFFFSSISHPSLLVILLIVLMGYSIYLGFIDGNLIRNVQKFFIIFFVFLIINVYWIFPLIYNTQNSGPNLQDQYGGSLSALRFNSQFADISSILRLKGQQILYEKYEGEYDYPWITLYHDGINLFTSISFLIPLIAFYTILSIRRKNILFLGLGALLLLFFVKGLHAPIGIIYEYLFKNFPFFGSFRDPYSKFGLFYTFFISLLFGIGLSKIYTTLKIRLNTNVKHLHFLTYITVVLLMFGIYSYPLWTGDVIPKGSNIRPSANIEIPQEYSDIATYFNNEKYSFKIIELPFQDRPLQSASWRYGYVGFPILRHLTSAPIIAGITGNEKENVFYRFIYKQLETNPSSIIPFLAKLNIKYIIVHQDINRYFAPPTNDPEEINIKLANSKNLSLIKSFGKLDLWKLESTYPIIYVYRHDNVSIEKKKFYFNDFNTTDFQIYVNSSNSELILTTNSTNHQTWSWIRSKEILVNKNEVYDFITNIKVKNSIQSHIVLEGYNISSDKWYQILQNPNGIDGNLEWKEFTNTLIIPEDVSKVRVVLNAGWVQNKTLGNATTWFGEMYLQNYASDLIDSSLNEISAIVSNYTKLDPTLYHVKVNASKPFMLAFAESYDPLWTAWVDKIDGKPVQPETIRAVPLYSVINGFYINQTGDLDITIEYEPQKWFYMGSAVSITTLMASFTYLVYDWRRNRKSKKKQPGKD